MDRLYVITKKGLKLSGDISAPQSDGRKLLDHLHEVRSSDIDTISDETGIPKSKAISLLRKLEQKDLIEELGRGREGYGY